MVGIIGDCKLTVITFSWLARDVKTFAKMEKNLGITVSALDKSKAFLGVVNCALFSSLVRNLKAKINKKL